MAKSLSVSVTPSGVLKRHEKMLDTIRGGTENEAIALFSEDGYDVNTVVDYTFDDRKKYKVTPLAWAVRCKRPLLCKYLLQNGADPYNHLVFDYYPLHEACNKGHDDIVKVFVDMKCDIDRVTGDNLSPLHIACMRGNIECARLLLDAGANRELQNNKGQTALELGIYHGHNYLDELFSYYDSKPRIRRRHSLHSPTGDPRPLLKLLPSTHSKSLSRPNSMLLDFPDNTSFPEQERTDLNSNDSMFTSLLVPALDSKTFTNRVRSRSNQNLASSGGLSQNFFTAAPHVTCSGSLAFSSSPLHCAPSTMNSMLSMSSSLCSTRPTLITQLSQASSSVADSPSPVERDGLLSTNSTKSDVSLRNNNTLVPSKNSELKPLELHANRVALDSRRTEHDSNGIGTQHEKSPRLVSSAVPHYMGSSAHHSSLSLRKQQPHHSISNPEFPLTTTHISVNQADRTHSYDDLYAQRKKPPFHPTDEVSPSREKINSLSSHICSSLDQNWAMTLSTYASSGSYQHLLEDTSLNSGSSPVCEVMQRIIKVTTPLLNFNQAHIQTLMELSSTAGSQSGHKDYVLVGAPSSLNTTCGSSFAEVEPVHDSPMSYLNKLGYKLIDKPLTVHFGVPLEGYMTLTFKLLCENLQTNDALLKVVVKIFDLKNKLESSSYHYSFDDRPISLFSDTSQLQEVSLLAHLSKSPHPNIASLITSFKANTSEQHELFAQQLNPDNPKKIYTTARTADFIVLEWPKVKLCDFLESQRRTRNLVSRSCDVIPESTVLSMLSQLLLAVSHLIKNQIAHCAVSSTNVYIDKDDSNSILLSNFSHAVQLNSQKLNVERISQTQARLRSEVNCNLSDRHCVLAPEVVEAVEKSELELAFLQGRFKNIFAKNDTYSAAWMVYSWFLNKSHSFLNRDRGKPYCYDEIPILSEFSPQCNHLLKKLVAYDQKERLTPMEGAIACFVLIFGPATSDIKTEDQCYKWLLAETVEFYMRPVLVDSKVRDYTDSFSKLLCVYLAVASSNPRRVWEACRFFSSYTV